jgi:hypothetical protein
MKFKDVNSHFQLTHKFHKGRFAEKESGTFLAMGTDKVGNVSHL